MISEVKVRLAGFGYEVKETDKPYLLFAVEKAKTRVKNNINCDKIPDGLFYETVDLAAGFFLMDKKTFAPKPVQAQMNDNAAHLRKKFRKRLQKQINDR